MKAVLANLMPTRTLCLLVCLTVNSLTASPVASDESAQVPHPVWFEENAGQEPGDVAFVGRGFGVPLFIFKNGTLGLDSRNHLVLLEPERSSALATVYGEAPTGAVTRSYAPGGASASRHYARVRVSSLWPGVDLFYRIAQGRLELGLDLMSGQTASFPSLRWRGAAVSLDSQGCVLVSAHGLRFAMRAPSATQPDGVNGTRAVDVSYRVSQGGSLSFRVPDADPVLPLNIDPVFDFSTYVGGAQSDALNAMALGPDGSIYLAGQTASTSLFGASTGIRAGSGKVLIARLAPGGVGVVYAAVIGGAGSEQGTGIAVDSSGSAYVTGQSNSSNFPTTVGAFQSIAPQDWNAFAVKLDVSGSLVYSTLLGGSGLDWGAAVAVDGSGRAVVAGLTNSADYPVSTQAYQKLYGGSQDCFVTMLAPDGGSAVFSTYLGGSNLDNCRAVALSPSGTITLAGSTRSSDFPVLGAFQNRTAGFLDGFVAQMDGTGSTLLSSSFLGGIGEDQISSVVIDGGGSVYVAGTTSTQSGFPGTGIGVVTKNGSGKKGFACKISTALVSLNWCSIVGGSGDDYVNAMALTPGGEVVVAGQTTSLNLPVVNAIQSAFQGVSDGWFAVLAPSGNRWDTVSYTGGAATNAVNAVQAFEDRILLAGSTTAQNLLTTSGAIQVTAGGNGDGFLQEVAMGGGIILNGLSPSNGTGLVHSLSFVVTDPSGGQAIRTVQVNVSNPTSNANACVVTFNAASKTLSLSNDAGSAIAGSAPVGSSSTLENSQCLVAAGASALSVVGNSVSLRLSLSYKPSFASLGAGAMKYVNVSAADNQGRTLSAPNAATWTLGSQLPPSVVSLTPASGQGFSQSFGLTVFDPAGASDLATVQLLIGSSPTLANSCAVTFNVRQNQFALASDSGTSSAGAFSPGQATTVSNSQCILRGSGSFVQLAGQTLTMGLNLQFTTGFANLGGGATKVAYALPLTLSGMGPSGGMKAMGTWTIPQPPQTGLPAVGSVTPSSGQGLSQSFTLSVSDPLGASDLATVQLLVGSSASLANSCSVTYIARQNLLTLADDAGTGYAGSLTPGQATKVANSQCALNGSGSSVSLSGNSLTMVVNIQFDRSFAGLGGRATKNLFALPINSAGQGPAGGIAAVGIWTLPQTVPSSPPGVTSLVPSNGQGSQRTFVLTVSDSAGASDLATVQLLIGSSANPANACAVTYAVQQNSLSLANDAGSGPAGSVTPGQAVTVSNSRCTLSGAGSSTQIAGTSLTIAVNIQFKPAFAGQGGSATKNVYAKSVNAAGQSNTGGYVAVGTWTVPQTAIAGPVVPVSLTPASGQGLSQVFSMGVVDTAGATDLATVHLIVSGPANLNNACWVAYDVRRKLIGLVNDAGSAYIGYVAPGQAASYSNSQCTLIGTGTSVQLSGTLLTLSVNLAFKSSFAKVGNGATKTVYAYPVNAAGGAPSSLLVMGSWKLP